MKHEIERAIDLCIEALNNRNGEASQTVEGDGVKVLETIHKIAQTPYQGRGLGIGDFGYQSYRSSWEDIYKRFEGKKNISYSLDWKTAVLWLYDSANYSEAKILTSAQKIVNDDIIFNHIMKHIMTNLVLKNEIAEAERLIPDFKKTKIFKESDNHDQGYLIILKHYALKGDPVGFFKYFKQSKPAVNKSELNELKDLLVQFFAASNGIEESIALCQHKNLGNKYYFSALVAFSGQGKYQELKVFFDKYPELKQPEIETELAILAAAYLEAKKNGFDIDDDFEVLFERAKGVNRKLRWGDLKLQDAIFLDLGLASSNDLERQKRCRKAIKDNRLKKELL
ncbi:hypothetical protein [Pedobacter caeni]|uniref:Uncharacterized protein n=1 Tax=Pedobacter caeni TaxID=288992 RepID=A0A1M4UEF6_9SPHI|nr:hypothetical protein [Pedobacter caeni]SHE54977.1 hypothetical protein SAMN04488522_101524 [Pedobacter caeni]